MIVDLEIKQTWGRLMVALEREDRPIPLQDSLIAATALVHQLILVTRKVKGFSGTGVKVLNPRT